MVKFQTKCTRCRKNYVTVSSRRQFGAVCYECQKKEMQGEIKDPEMKKLFGIPEEFYKQSSFLRNIKINYLKWGNLTEKQVEAFKKVVGDLKEKKD